MFVVLCDGCLGLLLLLLVPLVGVMVGGVVALVVPMVHCIASALYL